MKVVTQTTADGQTTTATHTLDFSYDASGSPMAVIYNGTTYYYALNLQGDVIAILNGSGSREVSYTYDAWGNVQSITGTMASTLGHYNPLRYRGYVYDTETKTYYLQSRYYNPAIGRFINADVFTSTGQGILGNNMFAYCLNNPVNYIDGSGEFPWHIVIAAIIGGGISALTTWLNGGSTKEILMEGLYGAAVGAIVAVYPQSAVIFASYELMTAFLDYLYMGYSIEEILAAMTIKGVSECALPSTGDGTTDLIVDSTFGVAKDLTCLGGEMLVEGKSRIPPNHAIVTRGIISVIATGSGSTGKTSMTIFDSVGRSDLWPNR